jgi:putative ABC transport system ATP-binding protein
MGDLRVENLAVEFAAPGYTVRPLDGLDMEAASGELALVVGPSGCGKTTLLSCLAGIQSPTDGVISFAGVKVTELGDAELAAYRRNTVGIVFQSFNLLPSLTALENVCMPLCAAGVRKRKAMVSAMECLEQVDLADRAQHRPGQLSGGQQQRVAVARALVHRPPLVIADEPTANLDYVQAEVVLRLLRDLAAPGRTVVIATHDERILPLADRVIRLTAGRPAEAEHRGPVELPAGSVLFEQGEMGELVYFVDGGEIELLQRRPNGTEHILDVRGPGSYFGELGPVLGFPRSATARARTDCSLTALSVAEFRRRSAVTRGRAGRRSGATPARRRDAGPGGVRAGRGARSAPPGD